MGFEVQVVHSVQAVDEETWDRLAAGHPFASHRWYRYGEMVLAGDLPTHILLAWNGEPVARATLWLRRDEPLPLESRLLRRLVGGLLNRWPLLICQAPLADASGLILPPPPLRDKALALIARVAREQAERLRASFVPFVYLGPAEAAYPGWPEAFGAVELPEPGTCLPIVWRDFEDYVQSRSKSTRKDYRRHGNRARDLGIEVTGCSEVTEIENALALVRDVEANHGAAPKPWARAALQHAGMVDGVWLRAEMAGRLVGCGLMLGDGDTWFLTLLGLDYNVQYVYFQLLYAALRCAIERGVRTLVGGTGSYETKRRLGFELVDTNYAAFAGRGPLLRGLGRWLGGAEERKVFDPYEA